MQCEINVVCKFNNFYNQVILETKLFNGNDKQKIRAVLNSVTAIH